MSILSRLISFLGLSLLVSSASYAGSEAHFPSFYKSFLISVVGMDAHKVGEWIPVVGGVFTLILILLVGNAYRSAVRSSSTDVAPSGKFGVQAVVEMLLDLVHGLASDIIGKKEGLAFFPLLAGLFVFILFSNLTGLVPGFLPATDSINTNLAMGIVVFLVYNFAGIKEHGASYIKQFLGPIVFLMPLMLVIELVQHLARPVSLSLRLYGNIFGDHLVLSVFTGLTYVVLPALLLFFGLLVASLQSFVFTLLTSIYISMAISHDH